MVETTLRDAIDGAEYVQFAETTPAFVAWHGGTTFNVFSYRPGDETPVHETDVFHVSDGEGRPPSRERAEGAVSAYLDRVDGFTE